MTQEQLDAKRRAEIAARRKAIREKQRRIRRRRRKMMFSALIVLLVVILLGLIVSIVRGKSGKDNEPTDSGKPSKKVTTTVAPTDSPIPTATSTPTPSPTPMPQSVSMIAVGDNLYDWYMLEDGWSGKETNTFDFMDNYDHIKRYAEMADFAVINQECPLGGDEGYQGSGTEWDYIGERNRWGSYHGYGTFNSPDAVGDAVIAAGFNVVTMATNHVSDYGILALNNSIKYWKNHPDITLLGIHDSQEDADSIKYLEKYGIKIACLNYTYGTNLKTALEAAPYSVDLLSEDKVKSDVNKARSGGADFVVVFVHWGTEYNMDVSDYQKRYTKVFLNAGVDAVVGAHPHIVEPMEWITRDDGTKMVVYYSLGNFISMFKDKRCELEGMAYLEFYKGQDGTFIKEGTIIPLVNHWNYDSKVLGQRKNYTVYAMQDYTEALAKEHGCVNFKAGVGYSYSYITKLAKDMWGDNIKTVDWDSVVPANRNPE